MNHPLRCTGFYDVFVSSGLAFHLPVTDPVVMTTGNTPTLLLEDVSFSHSRHKVLEDIGFAADGGEFVVILGANGAGKTSLVQLLTGLAPPGRGRIMIGGVDIAGSPLPALRRLGVVFQQQTLDLDLTVEGNLRFHAGLHGMDRRQTATRITELLDRFGLLSVCRHRAITLSGGNRRRVELARALLHGPDLLIMDEPTVGLDPASRNALVGHVLKLRDEGVLVLWTTHLLDEAERADRVMFLEAGRLLFDGPRGDIPGRNIEEAFFARTGRTRADRSGI